MTVRPNVDAGRFVNLAISVSIGIAVIGIAMTDLLFAMLVGGALAGACIGWVVFVVRSKHGLGASLTAERPPAHAGTINMAHIPVIGIGGLGILAMSGVVAFMLPRGQVLMMWSLTGAVFGAGSLIIWRHFHGATPFAEHPEETLHLR